MTKVLNLYAGIGGNRKLWKDVEVTAVEIDPQIAKIYQENFPQDKVIVGDAHQYLLDHYQEFDVIWSSPPCPTHSDIRRLFVQKGRIKPLYPDMALYQEIIFLTHFFRGKFVVENVESYYQPLIIPQFVSRHYFWANFRIGNLNLPPSNIKKGVVADWEKMFGFTLPAYAKDKRKLLRNCVHPKLGKHVFDCAFKDKQLLLVKEGGTK